VSSGALNAISSSLPVSLLQPPIMDAPRAGLSFWNLLDP
jgi:hypothetical protein